MTNINKLTKADEDTEVKQEQMITKIVNRDLTYYQLDLGAVCFLAFSLPELLKAIPKELKEFCLTKLN